MKHQMAKKQQTITKAFAKRDALDEETQELEKEVEELRKKLEEKERLCFQARHEALKYRQRRRKRGKEKANRSMGQRSVECSDLINDSKKKTYEDLLELRSTLTGIQVASYIPEDKCCVYYNICVDQTEIVRHGVQIRLDTDPQIIENYSLPVGFPLKDVTSKFTSMMERECLLAIQLALTAYYERLKQIELLQKMVPYKVKIFKIKEGSELEITAMLNFEGNSDKDAVTAVIFLSYGIFDKIPAQVKLANKDLDNECAEILCKQCEVFRALPLQHAFMEAFMKKKKRHYVCIREDSQIQLNTSSKLNKSTSKFVTNKQKLEYTKQQNKRDAGYSSDSGVSDEEDQL